VQIEDERTTQSTRSGRSADRGQEDCSPTRVRRSAADGCPVTGDLLQPRKLPPFLQELRETFYRRLAPAANRWAEVGGESLLFPAELSVFLMQNRLAGQTRALSHTTVIPANGYQALHQRAGDAHVFPFQLAGLLSEPQKEFTGGELVMVEQRPRMQSRPMVLPLKRGDVAVIATAQRPHKGSKAYYRVNMKHGISRVRSGERRGLEILFRDSAESRAS
jgi:hypothetical protein